MFTGLSKFSTGGLIASSRLKSLQLSLHDSVNMLHIIESHFK